jgi:hypothetical protein
LVERSEAFEDGPESSRANPWTHPIITSLGTDGRDRNERNKDRYGCGCGVDDRMRCRGTRRRQVGGVGPGRSVWKGKACGLWRKRRCSWCVGIGTDGGRGGHGGNDFGRAGDGPGMGDGMGWVNGWRDNGGTVDHSRGCDGSGDRRR